MQNIYVHFRKDKKMNISSILENKNANNTKIFIDTCVLMNDEILNDFIKKNEKTLLDNKIKIIISEKVEKELLKFYTNKVKNEENIKKLYAALNAKLLIDDHKDIFDIKPTNKEINKNENIYADKEFVDIVLNEDEEDLIFITNDKGLSSDLYNASNFNIRKMKGNVEVYYLSNNGEMKIRDYYKEDLSNIEISQDNSLKKCSETQGFTDKEEHLSFAVGLLGGIMLKCLSDNHGKNIIKNVKTLILSLAGES